MIDKLILSNCRLKVFRSVNLIINVFGMTCPKYVQ